MKSESTLINIGALSAATEIPTETLRTWERRYGFPCPERLPSGHRRYDPELIPHLRAIREALSQGYRPSAVLKTPLSELLGLLGDEPTTSAEDREGGRSESEWLEACISAIEELNGERLRGVIERQIAGEGFRSFALRQCPELLHEIGRRWEIGDISVAHEHFASFILERILSREWLRLSALNSGTSCLFACPEGENHTLGLHLAAYVAALAGCRIHWLGASCPVESVAAAATSAGAESVLLSFSASHPSHTGEQFTSTLRSALPKGIEVVVGGEGAPRDSVGTTHLRSLDELMSRLTDRSA